MCGRANVVQSKQPIYCRFASKILQHLKYSLYQSVEYSPTVTAKCVMANVLAIHVAVVEPRWPPIDCPGWWPRVPCL